MKRCLRAFAGAAGCWACGSSPRRHPRKSRSHHSSSQRHSSARGGRLPTMRSVFVWVYYSAQIFLLGAEFAKAHVIRGGLQAERQPVIALVPEFSRQFGVVVSQSVTRGKETLSIARIEHGTRSSVETKMVLSGVFAFMTGPCRRMETRLRCRSMDGQSKHP